MSTSTCDDAAGVGSWSAFLLDDEITTLAFRDLEGDPPLLAARLKGDVMGGEPPTRRFLVGVVKVSSYRTDAARR